MRNYLISFFKEFEYDERDAECLLGAYDLILENPRASEILFDAVSAYEANINLDFKEEILKRAKDIANATGIHPYTIDLLVFICLTKHLRDVYLEKGLDIEIYKNSVLDLKWKMEECKVVKGICGSFVAFCFPEFFNLTRFALGRLQFEISILRKDYERDGIKLIGGETKVISVHIPRDGTPMDKERCEKSYAMAKEFFKGEIGEVCAFVCHSWLLFPKNREFVPHNTNTYRFISEFDILEWGYNEGENLWRLFDTQELNPERRPTPGSLRRSFVEHLKRGGRVGWGYGIRIY